MKALIACEFSGIVRDEFIKLGHDALSCDLLESEKSGPHYKGNVLDIINDGWDIMIAHPPCTYLAVSGLHWNHKFPEREEKTKKALEFVKKLFLAPIPKIAIENPVSCISTVIRKPDQIIQPYQFGHSESKKTCIWLKNLPTLIPTQYADFKKYRCKCGAIFNSKLGKYGCPNCCGDFGPAKPLWDNQTKTGQNKIGPSKDRWKIRSRTYQGIAKAMAEQWTI